MAIDAAVDMSPGRETGGKSEYSFFSVEHNAKNRIPPTAAPRLLPSQPESGNPQLAQGIGNVFRTSPADRFSLYVNLALRPAAEASMQVCDLALVCMVQDANLRWEPGLDLDSESNCGIRKNPYPMSLFWIPVT